MEIIFTGDGQGRCVYDEAIDLAALGQVSIRRGSHVEPTSDARWQADMSPVSGPVLGPFESRSDALEAERDWLSRHWLIPATPPGSEKPSSPLMPPAGINGRPGP